MSNKVYLVARREWLENVRTKAFWIGLLILPVILVAAFAVPIFLEKTKDARKYAVIDESGWMLEAVERRAMADDFERVVAGLGREAELAGKVPEQFADVSPGMGSLLAGVNGTAQEWAVDWWRGLNSKDARDLDVGLSRAQFERVDAGTTSEALNQAVLDDEVFAYFAIGADPLNNPSDNRYVSTNLTDNDLKRWFRGYAQAELRERRMEARDVDAELAQWLAAEAQFESVKLSETGEEAEVTVNDRLRQGAPAAFVYLLWLSIFTVSQMLLSNTIEEKSNRLMEVLLSSVSPVQLMFGKILGIAATGLTMVLTWIGFLALAVMIAPKVLAGSGINMDFGFILGDPAYLVSFVVYFVLGYLLYAAILVAIGSVCNTLKEAQNLQSPIVLLLMVPLFAMIPIAKDPNGTLATVLSYVPPFTPFVMMNRAAGNVPMWEYILTTLLLLVTVAFAIWAAAKVFRIGVLMTGKPPSIKDMVRWVKAPVGKVPVRANANVETPESAN